MSDTTKPAALELVWEAIHATPEEFGGALLDPEAAQAALFYPGKVVRSGFLAWQKTRIDAPATCEVAAFDGNRDLWSVELGTAQDLSAVRGDEAHLALRVTPLRLAPDVLFAWVSAGRHVGQLACIDRQRHGVRWAAPAYEVGLTHISPDATRSLVASPEGPVRLLDAAGAQVAELGRGASESPEAALGDAGGVLLEEGTIRGFDRDGRPAWTLDMVGAEAAMGAERVLVQGDACFVAEPGAVKRVALADGATVWRADGIRGHELVVAGHGPLVVVHEPTAGATRVYRAATGAPIENEALEAVLHVAHAGEDLVASTEQGVVRVDAAGRLRWRFHAEDLLPGPLCVVGRDVLALALDEEEVPFLLRLDAQSGTERGRARSPLGGAPRLEPVGRDLVSLSNPLAVFLYRLR